MIPRQIWRLLSEPLIAQGYRVRAVKSGAGALKTIEVELPDLILLDIKMPGDGRLRGVQAAEGPGADARNTGDIHQRDDGDR